MSASEVTQAAPDVEAESDEDGIPAPLDAAEHEALLDLLQERIGHRFANADLLRTALTHSSWANENGGDDYERLEFLGDAVVDAIIARTLYRRFPKANEAILSRQKHRLISAEPLARIGRELGLGHVLRVGAGARKENVQHQAANGVSRDPSVRAQNRLLRYFRQSSRALRPDPSRGG